MARPDERWATYGVPGSMLPCDSLPDVAQAIRELVTRLEERRGEPYPPHPKARPKAPSTL